MCKANKLTTRLRSSLLETRHVIRYKWWFSETIAWDEDFKDVEAVHS